MKNPEYVLSASVARDAVLDYAAALAGRSRHPVGVTVLPSGSSLLYVLDTPELLRASFDDVVCPADSPRPHVVKSTDECPSA